MWKLKGGIAGGDEVEDKSEAEEIGARESEGSCSSKASGTGIIERAKLLCLHLQEETHL
jgi:hypothetical protein